MARAEGDGGVPSAKACIPRPPAGCRLADATAAGGGGGARAAARRVCQGPQQQRQQRSTTRGAKYLSSFRGSREQFGTGSVRDFFRVGGWV